MYVNFLTLCRVSRFKIKYNIDFEYTNRKILASVYQQ